MNLIYNAFLFLGMAFSLSGAVGICTASAGETAAPQSTALILAGPEMKFSFGNGNEALFRLDAENGKHGRLDFRSKASAAIQTILPSLNFEEIEVHPTLMGFNSFGNGVKVVGDDAKNLPLTHGHRSNLVRFRKSFSASGNLEHVVSFEASMLALNSTPTRALLPGEKAADKESLEVLKNPIAGRMNGDSFRAAPNTFALFEDGTLFRSCFPMVEEAKYHARWVEHEGAKYLIETAQYPAPGLKSSAATLIAKQTLDEPRCRVLDALFHNADLDQDPVGGALIQGDFLHLPAILAKVNLKTFDLSWEFRYQPKSPAFKGPQVEEFWVDSKGPGALGVMSASQGGLYLRRKRDGKQIKLAAEGFHFKTNYSEDSETGKKPPFEIKDGIFSVAGIHRKIDLEEVDTEIRISKRLQPAESITVEGKFGANQTLDPATEVLKLYKDVTQGAESYIETVDPQVIKEIAKGVISRRSVAVLGDAGVGKTSAVKAFAREVVLGRVKGVPRTTKIIEVQISKLETGTKWAGEFSKKMNILLAAARSEGWIYFTDEVHTWKGAGTHSKNENDATQSIKQDMEAGTFLLIGTDTHDDFINAFSVDQPFLDRFKQVTVTEPSKAQVAEIVKRRVDFEGYEVPSDDLVMKGIDYSARFSSTESQPRKAVNFFREACAECVCSGDEMTEGVFQRVLCQEYHADPALFDISQGGERVKALREGLSGQIIGQLPAQRAMVSVFERKLTEVGSTKYVNSTLLAGPSGVGKSYIAELAADLMGYSHVNLEMSKYDDFTGVKSFRSEIFRNLKKNPFHVFILDEIDKTPESVQNAALSMLATGEFLVTEKLGGSEREVTHKVKARDAIFILTSNAANQFIAEHCKEGLSAGCTREKLVEQMVNGGGRGQSIIPALLSRIRTIVPMPYPTADEFRKGAEFYVDRVLAEESKRHGVQFALRGDRAALIDRVSEYYSERAEFRLLQNLVMLILEEPISKMLIENGPGEQGLGAHGEWLVDWTSVRWPQHGEAMSMEYRKMYCTSSNHPTFQS